jgi:hypothetical protein
MSSDKEFQNKSRSKLRLALCASGLILTCLALGTLKALFQDWDSHKTMIRCGVRGNMRTCQIAAESYAEDHSGLYPETVNDKAFRSYFPQGSKGPPYKPGQPPINPATKQWNWMGANTSDMYEGIGTRQWPVDGKTTDVKAARQQAPSLVGKGVVEYSVIYNDKHQPVSYAIRGGDSTALAVTGYDTPTLVLSNR